MQDSLNFQTYLINLDRSKDRLERMEKEFEKSGIHKFERIRAVDARNLKDTDYTLKNRYDRNLVPGEIGCFLSHIKTMQTFLKSSFRFAIIIEDDAKLEINYKRTVEKSIEIYDSLPEKHQWDVLKLKNGKRRSINVQQLDETYFIGACGTSIPISTLGAIWTRKGAEKFLKKTLKNGIPIIKRPIDCELQHAWNFNLRIYNLLPSVVDANPMNSVSEIHHDVSLRKAKLLKQIFYELNRLFPKYYYYLSHHSLKKFVDSFISKRTKLVK
ncbi:glycosyltransferase family 25 protein [Tamlana crocina]